MSELWLALAAVGLAAAGSLLRQGPGLSRWAALAAVVALWVWSMVRQAALFTAVAPPPLAVANLPAEPSAAAAVLAAAARAAPGAHELAVVLHGAGPAELPTGPLGAVARHTVEPLPFAPEQVRAWFARAPTVGRPTTLCVHVPDGARGCRGVVRIEPAAGPVVVQEVHFGSGPIEVPFLPAAGGAVRVAVAIELPRGRMVRAGEAAVAPPPLVWVAEPSGIVAAALTAQGFAVRAFTPDAPDAPAPEALTAAAALVVGMPLPAGFAQTLGPRVEDGLGLFVLAPGFGAPGEPLRVLLPLLPAPPTADDGAGHGGGAARRDAPAEPSPTLPEAPPPAAPPPNPAEAGPVSPEPIEVDKHRIAMMLVVDRSGSMGQEVVAGRNKMSYAKTSAWQTSQVLLADDVVGVVTFGNKGAGRVELPLTSAQDQAAIRAGIERLAHARENTYLLSGLQVARRQLQGNAAAIKHVVVITDGEFDLDERFAVQREVRQLRQEGVTVSILSIVAAGSADEYLGVAADLAALGGGQFLAESDATRVPVFVSAEVARALQRAGRQPPRPDGTPGAGQPPQPEPPRAAPLPPREPPADAPPLPEPRAPSPAVVVVRTVAETPLLEPEPEPWPPLGAAVAGRAPLDARVLLVAGDAGWPLLAFGHRGLGRVGAFAADLCGPDGAAFRAEALFPARLAKWLQHVQRAEAAGVTELALATQQVPAAPTPAAIAALARLAGEASALGPAPDAPRAPHWLRGAPTLPDAAAWGALAVLLGLAALEWWQRRAALRSGGD